MNLIGYVFIVVLLGYIIFSYFKNNYLMKNGVKVIGKVISVKHFSSPRSNGMLEPVTRATYEFYYNGERFTVSDQCNSHVNLLEGDEVTIYVNPKNPRSNITPLKEKRDDSNMMVLIVFAALIVLFLIFIYLI